MLFSAELSHFYCPIHSQPLTHTLEICGRVNEMAVTSLNLWLICYFHLFYSYTLHFQCSKKQWLSTIFIFVLHIKSCRSCYLPPILPSCLALSSPLTHLWLLADVLCSDRKLLRASAEQSEPSSLLSAAICRRDYLLVHSAVLQAGPVGISRPMRAFTIEPVHVSCVVCCLHVHASPL